MKQYKVPFEYNKVDFLDLRSNHRVLYKKDDSYREWYYPAEWWIDLLLKYTNKKYCVEDRSLFYFGTTREGVANE